MSDHPDSTTAPKSIGELTENIDERMAADHSIIENLPFVANRDGKTLPKYIPGKELPRCFWHPAPTGSHAGDENLGEKYALEFLHYLEADKSGMPVLQWIVGDMPRPVGPVEVGFLTIIQYAAARGGNYARGVSAYWDACRAEGVRA